MLRKFPTSLFFLPFLTILFFHLNRFLIPDYSFDTINYHLFVGQRALANGMRPFGAREFFPSAAPNYAGGLDLLATLLRLIVGYRLGASLNTIALLISVLLSARIVCLFIPNIGAKNRLLACFLFFNLFIINESLLQLATYFVDNVHALLVIAGYYFCVKCVARLDENEDSKDQGFSDLLKAAFFFSLALYCKLTAAALVLPVGAITLFFYLKIKKLKHPMAVLRVFFIFALVSLPQTLQGLYLWTETGNPLFPLFNGIFKSNYFIHQNYSPHREGFGPGSLWEQLIYPYLAIKNPTILSEIGALFSDHKIFLYWPIALGLLACQLRKPTLERKELLLLLGFIFSFYLWTATSGATRYAIFVEMTGAILMMVALFRSLFFFRFKTFRFGLLAFLLVQDYRVLSFNCKYEYSWRPPLIQNLRLHARQLRSLFNSGLNIPAPTLFEMQKADIVLNCETPSIGYSVLTSTLDKPVVLLHDRGFSQGLIDSKDYVGEARRHLGIGPHDSFRFLSFLYSDDAVKECLHRLEKAGLKVESRLKLDDFLGYPLHPPVILIGSSQPPSRGNP